MERIEFLERTDHRNLKFQIDFMVKQHLRMRNEELEIRRSRLYNLLENENLQYDEEIAMLLRKRLEDNARKRLEWIGTMRIERERAEEQLLKLKQLQRELENSEEVRHLETKKLLLDTKNAQLYQIAEKKAMREKQKQIERMWLEVEKRLSEEKLQNEIFEQKLQNVISGCMQKKNIEQVDEMKKRQLADTELLKMDCKLDNERATNIAKDYKEKETTYERRKKLHHGIVLQQQIKDNNTLKQFKQQMESNLDSYIQDITNNDTSQILERKFREEVRNREWHKLYLGHTQNERQSRQQRENLINSLLTGKECVLYQQNKKPYNKEVR